MVTIEVHGAQIVAAGLAGAGPATVARWNSVVRMYGQLLLTGILRHASGRPGPNAPTGHYRRTWSMEFHSGANPEAILGTNAPQGRRLEFGFHGVDALGRHFHQAPYEHVRPATDEILQPFGEALFRATPS